ncbi:MAG: permease-like cell division protein FtsX [Clostridia bacterium]|nr:permease-like cell division protein FtsX [Clostridia bacterium]
MFERASYFFKQSIRNIFSRRALNFATVFIVISALVLLGFFLAVGSNISAFVGRIGDSKEINVYLSRDTEGYSILDIEGQLKNIEGVAEVRFYSRADRLQKVTEEVYGEDGYDFDDKTNPLRDSYILVVSDFTDAERVSKEASDIAGVEEVVKNSDIISGIDMISHMIRWAGIWMNVIFILVAIFIISNSIKLGISSCEEEIKIMKIIGATDKFISAPFIIQGLLLGVFSALIASGVVLSGYGMAVAKLGRMVSANIISFVTVGEIAAVILPILFAIGVVIGVAGSIASVRIYLKR